MDDLEAIRQRKLRELQQQAAAQDAAQEHARESAAREEQQLDSALLQILEPEARERLARIRMTRPELADVVTRQLVSAAQQGRLARRVGDEDLKKILLAASPKDRDIRITRK